MLKLITMPLITIASRDLTASVKLKPSWSCVERYNRLLEAKLKSSSGSGGGISLEALLAFAKRFFSPRNLARVQLYVHGNCSPENALGFAAAVDERLIRRAADADATTITDGRLSAPADADGGHTNTNSMPHVCHNV